MNIDEFVIKNATLACQGLLMSVAMSGAVIFGVAFGSPGMSSFAAFGSMLALYITPHHGAMAKIIGVLCGCLFLLFAACFSDLVSSCPLLALTLLFLLSWLAALPKADILYISLVFKYAAIAVLLNYFDFSLSLSMGLYFGSGLIFGLILSLMATAFETENEKRPIDQLRALLHGDINTLRYSLVIPVTVVISSLIAESFSYANPAWVGLTVIFVATSNQNMELRRAFDRIIGTVAGAAAAFLILCFIQLPLRLALIVGLLAFFLPFVKKKYCLFSILITCIVLVLINIAMAEKGGAMGLLLWRCIDTAFGCGCVLVSNLVMRLVLHYRHPEEAVKLEKTK